MKSVLLLWAPLVLLAGCSSQDQADDSTNAAQRLPIKPGPVFAGFDLSKPLRLRGTVPEWELDLAPGRIQYRAADGKETPYYPVSPRLEHGTAIYPTQTPDGEPVTITLMPQACSGVTGKSLVAELQIAARKFAACATPLPIEQIRYDMYNEAEAVPYNAAP